MAVRASESKAAREADAKVAAIVMGYGDRVKMWGDHPVINDAFPVAVPNYTTDVVADLSVLVHVRETWDTKKFCELGAAIEQIWEGRNTGKGVREGGSPRKGIIPPSDLSLLYVPGDYSRAALAVLAAS